MKFLKLSLVFFLGVPGILHAQDRFYLLVFAAEGNPPLAHRCHTFASLVKVTHQEKFVAKEAPVEVQTISWFPASLQVALLRPPEVGRNLDIKASIEWTKSLNGTVFLWGPYEVKKELYDLAQQQVERLNSGKISYKAIDWRFRPNATNCISAVADMDSTQGMLLTGRAYGVPASSMVAQYLQKWRVDSKATHPWLIDRLELRDHNVPLQEMDRPPNDPDPANNSNHPDS